MKTDASNRALGTVRLVATLFVVLILACIALIDAPSGLAQEDGVGSVVDATVIVVTPPYTSTATATPVSASPAPDSARELEDKMSGIAALPIGEADTYEGIPVGFTEAGDPYMGDPDAPVTIFEYSDYLCPFCSRHFNQTLPTLIEDYVSKGTLQYVFLDNPIASLHPTAELGHVAARCVGEQGSSQYWAMHDALFSRQSEWSGVSAPRLFLDTVAASLEIDMKAYTSCLWSERQVEVVAAHVAQATANGVTGTPTFDFVRNGDGERFTLVGANPANVYVTWMDALLAGEDPPIVEEPKAELPYWANAEGLAPDPDRPGFTMAGDPYKGSPDASLAIVEFSDFQCPACATHANEVQPSVESELIATGLVRWVFKNFPLRVHPQALAAATAAECAADQGQFWPMHDLLFEKQDEWGVDDVDVALQSLAEELNSSLDPEAGLNIEAFMACTTSRQALERVLPDIFDAQGIVSSTPTFVFLDGETGTLYKGTRDAADFVGLVKRFIGSSNTP